MVSPFSEIGYGILLTCVRQVLSTLGIKPGSPLFSSYNIVIMSLLNINCHRPNPLGLYISAIFHLFFLFIFQIVHGAEVVTPPSSLASISSILTKSWPPHKLPPSAKSSIWWTVTGAVVLMPRSCISVWRIWSQDWSWMKSKRYWRSWIVMETVKLISKSFCTWWPAWAYRLKVNIFVSHDNLGKTIQRIQLLYLLYSRKLHMVPLNWRNLGT